MKNPLKQFKKDAENIKLSTNAKMGIYASLQETMSRNPLPVSKHTKSFFSTHRFALASMAIAFIGVGSSYAAEVSRPGDIFYPVKIHVNEKLLEAIAFTPEAEAEVKITLVERRVEEMQEIVSDDSADVEEIDFLEHEVDRHTFEVREIARSKKIKDKQTTRNAIDRLSTVLEKHNQTLSAVIDPDPEVEIMTITSTEVTNETMSTELELEADANIELEEVIEIHEATIEDIRETLMSISEDLEETREDLEDSENDEEAKSEEINSDNGSNEDDEEATEVSESESQIIEIDSQVKGLLR